MPLFYNDSVQARSLADRYLKGDVYGGDLDYEVIRRRVGEWETYTGDLTD